MDFSNVSSLLKQRKIDRRRAIQGGAAGLAATGLAAAGLNAASAEDGTPATGDPADQIEFLFVQSFQGGSIAPKDGAAGEYTVTFDHGLGQTVFFSDRPDRIVGAAPTGQFLEGLGFLESNPPNAAIVFEGEDGVDVAVVELTNPVYDEATATATYDVKVLENYDDFGVAFHGTAADLESVAGTFGTSHLLIDNCDDHEIYCRHHTDEFGTYYSAADIPLGNHGFCWNWSSFKCEICGYDDFWTECNVRHADYCIASFPCIPAP